MVTLFLGKPPRDSLPVFTSHSFTSNLQLALLESAEERQTFPQNNVPDRRVDLGTACI